VHPRLTEELLEREVQAVRDNDFLLRRIAALERDGSRVLVTCTPPSGADAVLCFTADDYDGRPLDFKVLDPATGADLPGRSWPPGLYFGSDHPVLSRPFTCLRGLGEYHLHPSHIADRWDRLRYELRLPVLLGQILTKAGVSA
jgi:hypothetical protein